MAIKFVLVLALFALANAGYVPEHQHYQHAPVLAHSAPLAHKAHSEDYDDHPKYNFEYGVEDKHTGDIKSQSEQRDGDAVHGEYSLIDADGYKRTVHYTADDHNGFQAEVHREPLSSHAVKSAPVAHYAAPTLIKSAAPSHHYAAPAVVKSYAAPKSHQSAHPAAHFAGYEHYHH